MIGEIYVISVVPKNHQLRISCLEGLGPLNSQTSFDRTCDKADIIGRIWTYIWQEFIVLLEGRITQQKSGFYTRVRRGLF